MSVFLFRRVFVFLLSFVLSSYCNFYLPGVKPHSFDDFSRVPLKANKVTSTKTQIPFEYYDLPFCKARNAKNNVENLGQSLTGDAITESPYELLMKHDESCKILCRKVYDKNEGKEFRDLIEEEYRVHWLLDSLPVVVRDPEYDFVSRGYPIGFVGTRDNTDRLHFLYNHVRITIRYYKSTNDGTDLSGTKETYFVTGFEVVPFSIHHDYDKTSANFDEPKSINLKSCNPLNPAQWNPAMFQTLGGESPDGLFEVIYTYDVNWVESDIDWSQRWDIFLHKNPDNEIHYFSIINSLMIVLFLSGVVAMILLRTLRKEISAYNDIQSLEEAREESGWKLVHGDVFRPPMYPMLLSVLVGSGCQVLGMTVVTMLFALFGFYSPNSRGGLLTILLLLFVFMGSLAGYHSSRIYKLAKGKQWKQSTLLTSILIPALISVIFATVNIMLSVEGSSSTVPFTGLLSLLFLWLGISTPLVFLGSFFGFSREEISVPVRTKQIPRVVPPSSWYTHPLFAISLGGVLPFGAVCIELFFVMSALWLDQIYYVFGFLLAVLAILIVTCAEISIVMCYFQLCNADYQWWWRSFLSSGSSGCYLLLYSIWYYHSKLQISGVVSTSVYFGYMSILSLLFGTMTGAIGFLACLWFVRVIYGAIKVD